MPKLTNRKIAAIWGAVQIIVLSCLYCFCYQYVSGLLKTINTNYAAFMDPKQSDPGVSPINWASLQDAKPDTVVAGIYLDRIMDFDMVKSNWSYEYYAWFRWNPKKLGFVEIKDNQPKAITKNNAPFKIINGDILDISTESFYVNDSGDSAYIMFFVKGASTQFFNVSTFPLDRHVVMIQMEHTSLGCKQMYFMADTAGSNVSSRVAINGYTRDKGRVITKFHTYKSALGDPRKGKGYNNTFAQFRFGLTIKRSNIGIYIKLFASLYIAVLVAFLSFFASEIQRVTLVIGSLYTTVASLYILTTKIPITEIISVGELVNSISLVTIFLIAANETIGKFLVKDNKPLFALNQWVTLYITLAFYILFNITIPFLVFNS